MDYGSRIGVFFVGNYYVCDDGFAIHLYERLKQSPRPEWVDLLKVDFLGVAAIDLIRPYHTLIIIDALTGKGRAGEIFRFDLLAAPSSPPSPKLSAHDFGVSDLLDLVASLYPEQMPERVILYGVEAVELSRYGTTLSPPLRNALPIMQQMLEAELAAVQGCRATSTSLS